MVIFGAGSGGQKALFFLEQMHLNVAFFVDNSVKINSEKNFLNYKIFNPDVLKKQSKNDFVVLIASVYAEEISKQLLKMQLEENNHFYSVMVDFHRQPPIQNLYDEQKLNELLEISSNLINRLSAIENKIDFLFQVVPWDCTKLYSGERQVAKDLSGIRCDHLGRYEFVRGYINDNDNILDIACGIGYGTYLLADYNKTISVLGVDISNESIDFANGNYKIKNNKFMCSDALNFTSEELFDKIVSYETIEHIANDRQLLLNYNELLKSDGTLFLSTPNENVYHFSKKTFPFHIKHYTPDDLEKLLSECNFKIMEVYAQETNTDRKLKKGWDGAFNIVVCKKSN